jgi:hypothetical protein
MTLPVPFDRLREIMGEYSIELQRRIGAVPMQLSLPLDGQGVRVKVSVPPGYRSQIPDQISFTLHGQAYNIPLDVREDYQSYVLFSPKGTAPRRA